MSFVRPSGPCPARIMIVGEFPGEQEVLKGMPFVGMAGQELDRMLKDAGIMRSTCFVTNVMRERPQNNDISLYMAEKKKDITPRHVLCKGRWVLPQLVEGVDLLSREIELCQPNVIIALGNVALWALASEWGVVNWRGSELECDLPLALSYKPRVIPTYHPAVILKRMDWRNIAVHDLRKAKSKEAFREINPPDYKFLIRPDFGQVVSVLQQLDAQLSRGPVKLAADIETRAGHISCVGIAWSKLDALCIPFMCIDPGKEAGYWNLEEEVSIQYWLKRVLTHKNAQVIGQNFSYDAQYFMRHFLYHPRLARDTMLSQHVCFSSMQKSLDFLSSMYCQYHRFWKDEGRKWTPADGEDQHWEYNCKDCVITFEVDEVLVATQEKMGYYKPPKFGPDYASPADFQQSLFWPVLHTMDRGLRMDMQRRARFAGELFEEIAKREQYFIDMLGRPLNPKSSPQMQSLFYEELGQKVVINRKSKTHGPSCDDEALRKIVEREPLLKGLCNRISEYRSLNVFLSTFVNAPLDIDGRMRCSFNIAGTETYRFSSSKNAFDSGMNLQNIPKGGDEGEGLELPNVRLLFIPDPGFTFFDIDLDSADLRIVQREADIPEMGAMLDEGKKVYVEVMKEYCHDQTLTKHSPQYKIFKGFCHGTHYLGTAKGLAERMGLLVADSEKLQKWYYGKFPELKKWQDEIKNQVLKRRWIENVFGYRTYFLDRIEGTIFNQAIAWIPQSTVGCLINRGYDNIENNEPEVQVLLQVHDSLAGQFPSSSPELKARIKHACEVPLPYAKPMTIPVDIVTSDKSWGDCK